MYAGACHGVERGKRERPERAEVRGKGRVTLVEVRGQNFSIYKISNLRFQSLQGHFVGQELRVDMEQV
jgi:hypothetical protein